MSDLLFYTFEASILFNIPALKLIKNVTNIE